MISDKGAEKIAEGIYAHSHIEAFLLCKCESIWTDGRDISDKGAEMIGETIRDKMQTRRMYLWGSDITEKGVKKLFERLKTNRWIEVLQIGTSYGLHSLGSKKLSHTFCNNFMVYAEGQNPNYKHLLICDDHIIFNEQFSSIELVIVDDDAQSHS